MNFKTIGIVAHVDAGKTTFSEQLLYQMNSIKTKGRVDHQDAFLDNHAIERQRGITIFAEQGRFTYEQTTYTLIDTPGHVDFAPEMERAICVMDAAILLISAVEGIQGHTEAVWRLLREANVPTYIFMNKIDREGANVDAVCTQIRQQWGIELVEAKNSSAWAEYVAMQDEALLELWMDGTLQQATVLHAMQQAMQAGDVVLWQAGAALQGQGIDTFFEAVHTMTQPLYDEAAPLAGRVFKIRHDDQRWTFFKVTRGTLRVRDELQFHDEVEKVTDLRVYNGTKFEAVQAVQAGDICAIKGIKTAQVGDILGETTPMPAMQFMPTLQAAVQYEADVHVKEVLRYFMTLELEEPTLQVQWNERFQTIYVHVCGVIQLEVLTEVVRERFGLPVTFGQPQILYKETIAEEVVGYGHFEPLKHYAEVHLRLQPMPSGHGITTTSACHADDLTIGHQRLIQQHVVEQPHRGLLTGYPLTDVHVTVLTGRAHQKHTEGGDFREATKRAIRQALEQVETILLEPYYRFTMKAPTELLGRMMNDVQQASGTFDPPMMDTQFVTLTGHVPVATFLHYSTQFAAYTNGKGMLSLQVSGYAPCHNAEEVIARIGYDKQADPDYSSSSVFCAKGKGYTVPWYEAKAAMHCPTE